MQIGHDYHVDWAQFYMNIHIFSDLFWISYAVVTNENDVKSGAIPTLSK